MDRNEVYSGYFWLDDESSKVSGEIRLENNEKPILELSDPLYVRDEQIVNGVLNNNKSISIQLFSYGSFLINEFPSKSHQIKRLYFNSHEESYDELQQNQYTVEYTNIDYWVKRHGLTRTSSDTQVTFVGNYDNYKRTFNVNKDLTIEYVAGLSSESYKFYPMKIELEFRSKFIFRYRKKIQLDLALEDILHLSLLLSLFVEKPVYVDSIFTITTRKLNGDEFQENCEVYDYSNSRVFDKTKVSNPSKLCSFDDIQAEFGSILIEWFKKRQKLVNVLNLYTSNIYSQERITELQFLNYIKSLEVIHRTLYDEKEFDNKKIEDIRESIKNGVEGDIYDKVKNKINYINELSLKKRIKKLYDIYLYKINDYMPSRKLLAYNSTLLRNYYTHFDDSLNSEVQKVDVYMLIRKLKIAIQFILISETGISDDLLIKLYEDHTDKEIMKLNELNITPR